MQSWEHIPQISYILFQHFPYLYRNAACLMFRKITIYILSALDLKQPFSTVRNVPMKIPRIGELMTPFPKTIGEDIPIATAKKYMSRDKIRHLPVLKAGNLVGIISDRDIKAIESFQNTDDLTVGEVMTHDPFIVGENEPLDQVLLTMAEKKYGSVLIHREGSKVIAGIFTDTDALRFCGQLLRNQAIATAA
jgi:acetoin utilization protein AcuB